MNIPIDNTEELDAAIQAEMGKASRHVHTAKDVQEGCREILEALHRHLPPGMLVGSQIILSSKPTLPASYGSHHVIFSRVVVNVEPRGLVVSSVERHTDSALYAPGPRVRINLPGPIKDFLKNQLLQEVINIR